MNKIVQNAMVISVIETWTMTWTDGTEVTVTYRSMQFYLPLSRADDDSHTGNDLDANISDPDPNHDASDSK
jgi:hypothetical protein